MRDPAGQGFGPLPAEVWGSASEKQEPRGEGRPVGEDAKDRKEARRALDFVDDDKAPQVAQGQHRLRKTRGVRRILQIKPGNRAAELSLKLPGQGRLANLPGAQDCYDRMPGNEGQSGSEVAFAADHG